MKKETSEVRNKLVVVRLNEAELTKLTALYKSTTDRYLSTYVRKVILQKPVTVKYRNASADAFLSEMLQLRKELNGIGNNFNQAVRKLNALQKIPEFRAWVTSYEKIKEAVENKIEDIKVKTTQLYEQWLQK